MKKYKSLRKLIVAIVIFSMMAIYGSVPTAKALSLTDAKDLLSDSDPGQLSNHTITFTSSQAIPAGGDIRISLDANFGVFPSATCSNGGSAATSTDEVICTYAGGLVATSSHSIVISNVVNSAAGFRLVTIETRTAADVAIENVDVMVAIVEDVTMSATVTATLQFTVAGTTTAAVVNGVQASNNSTSTTTPFGTLVVGATSTVAQDLSVITNADQGYVVTVFQDGELENTTGSNINSFKDAADGAGLTTPEAWAAPSGTLDQTNTYGHMGLTISDGSDFGNEDFSGSQFAGLNGSNPLQIMSHNGPSDGVTANKGFASVLYQVEIHALQEAGDYTNTLTYVCTPTF